MQYFRFVDDAILPHNWRKLGRIKDDVMFRRVRQAASLSLFWPISLYISETAQDKIIVTMED